MTSPLKAISFKALFDAAADAMLLVNNNGKVVEANIAALQLLEYTDATISGLSVESLMPDRFRVHHQQYREVFFKNPVKRSMGNSRELFALSSSGKELAVDIGLSPIKVQNQQYILITFYAAVERREAEQALRISEERLQLAKQAAGLGVFDLDLKNLAFHCDEKMLELWGEKPDKPMSYDAFISAIHPDDRTARQIELERCSDPSGKGEYKMEYRITKVNDGNERWVSSVGKMHFRNGEASRLVGLVRDITEYKMAEKNLQEQRVETEQFYKQQIAAHTASAIAHDLNQPLAAISAYSEVALHALSNASANPELLKRALEGCVVQTQRAGTSLHELIAFLQEGELITERFDLNNTVQEALNITKGDGFNTFQPILILEPNLPAVLANRTQIQKVLVNLLRNAVEAMRSENIAHPSITVTVKTHQDLSMSHVTIQDCGPGVSQELVKRIFEPFFTTKLTGIGMGLAISRALIEANGGQLWLDTNSKNGAIFHFTLPYAP